MKKLIIIISFLTSLSGHSQIILDFQTSELCNATVRLSNHETKYLSDDADISSQNQFDLFNLDGTLFKTIQLPPKPNSSVTVYIQDITRTLFDNDSTNIEFLIYYEWDTYYGTNRQTDVVREDGTILLSEADAEPGGSIYFDPKGIYNTEEGTKLRLFYLNSSSFHYQTKVFNLPGKLPDNIKDDLNFMDEGLVVYPNPNHGVFYIKLQTIPGDIATIRLYSQDGRLINTYKSTENLFQIQNYGLSDGLYLINANHRNSTSTSKMIIKK